MLLKRFISLAVLGAAVLLTGCQSVPLEASSPTPDTVQALRTANLAPTQVGKFELAPGKPKDMDASASVRAATIVPSKGSFAQVLKDTLVVELKAAGLHDPTARRVIEGQLTDSLVDPSMSGGKGRLAARFKVLDEGRATFDKELAVDATWESSFLGAVAIPTAITQYTALYKVLVAKLVNDPDFRRALAKP